MSARPQRGFSLLELLVALAIFALAAGALLHALGEQARHSAHLEARFFARLSAHNELALLRLQPAWPALGERQRQVEMAGREFRLTEIVAATDAPNLRRVSLSVSDTEGQILAKLDGLLGPTP